MNKRVEMTRTAEENPECGIWDLNTKLTMTSSINLAWNFAMILERLAFNYSGRSPFSFNAPLRNAFPSH